jgi:hypothetical protein
MNLTGVARSRLASLCAGLSVLALAIAACGSGAPSAMLPTTTATDAATAAPTNVPTATGVPSQIGVPVVIHGRNISVPFTVTVTAAAMGDRAECLVDPVRPDFFAGVHTGPWTHTSGCWIDSNLPAGQTLLAVHASVDGIDAGRLDTNPTVADVTGPGSTYPVAAFGEFKPPTEETWIFEVPKVSLFSGVYFIRFDSGDQINLGAVAYTP